MTDLADFGALGANVYPGRLAMNWGAQLVEPSGVRAIRRQAGSRLVSLRNLAPPHSGIPTRSVKYFCVEEVTDSDALAQYEIATKSDRRRLALVRDGRGALHVIERAALKPIIRRPALLEGRVVMPPEVADPWRLFSVQLDLEEIRAHRWQHVLRYIDYGARTDFRGGTRRRGGVVAKRANVASRRLWWAVPTIPDGPGRIAWLKGRGDVHFVPELPEGVVVPDNFQYSSPPDGLKRPRLLAAVANLSWTHVMLETFGRRAAGDGVLQTYLRELNSIPMLDPRQLTATEADCLLEAYDRLASQPILAVTQELQRPERQEFDRVGMTLLVGADRAPAAANTVARALRDLVGERLAKAIVGREHQSSAKRRRAFDPEPIAAQILELEGSPPDIRVLLGELDAEVMSSLVVDIPQHEWAEVAEIGASLFDQGAVIVNGATLVTAASDSHAEAILSALTTDPGLQGPLVLPRGEDETRAAVVQWKESFAGWCDRVRGRAQAMLPGAARAHRRAAVSASAERQAGTLIDVLQ